MQTNDKTSFIHCYIITIILIIITGEITSASMFVLLKAFLFFFLYCLFPSTFLICIHFFPISLLEQRTYCITKSVFMKVRYARSLTRNHKTQAKRERGVVSLVAFAASKNARTTQLRESRT